MKYIQLFFAALFLLVSSDLLWFGLVANNFYRSSLGFLLRTPLYWPAALFVWGLMVLGLLIFVLPRMHNMSSATIFFYGALYGFILYGVYNFTNYATIDKWPLALAFVDLAWGTFINGFLALFLSKINHMLK